MTSRASLLPFIALLSVASACTFVQTLEEPAVVELPPHADSGIVDAGALDVGMSTDARVPPVLCPTEAFGSAQDTGIDVVLVLVWERLDGRVYVERDVATWGTDRRSFRVATGPTSPPPEARVAETAPRFAVGHVYGVSRDSTASGLVDGANFRKSLRAGTYRDVIVWVSGAPPEASMGTWVERVKPGYSVWRCSDSQGDGLGKDQAFVESTCDGLRLESAGDPTGDRHCDWH
jgi:hypothetical protein